MQPQLGIRRRFIRSLLRVDRCSLSWASGRGLLDVYWGWTDAASAGDQEEVYYNNLQIKCNAGDLLKLCHKDLLRPSYYRPASSRLTKKCHLRIEP